MAKPLQGLVPMRSFVLILSFLLLACVDDTITPVATQPESSPPEVAGSSPEDADAGETLATPPRNEGNVTIRVPEDRTTLTTNPFTVEGTARTFENNVVVEVLDEEGDRILQTSTTARGELGSFNPWKTELWLTSWPGKAVTVRALEHSAKDGSVRSLAAVTLDNGIEQREITLYLPNERRSPNDCSVVHPVSHVVPASIGMARLLVESLLSGPTRFEQAQGFTSPFPPGARVESIAVDGSTVTVDFSAAMQNVGGSCRVQAIRAAIERTLEELPNVDRVRITAGGSEELALQP